MSLIITFFLDYYMIENVSMDFVPKAVVGIVNENDTILVGKKEKRDISDTLSEKWHIPRGKIEANETPEQAIIREIVEETGIQAKVSKQIDIRIIPNAFAANGKPFGVIWFELNPENGKLNAASDLTHAKWVPKNKVLQTVDAAAIELFPPKVKDYFS